MVVVCRSGIIFSATAVCFGFVITLVHVCNQTALCAQVIARQSQIIAKMTTAVKVSSLYTLSCMMLHLIFYVDLGLQLGLGIGISLGVLILIALIPFLFWIWKTRRASETSSIVYHNKIISDYGSRDNASK